MIYGFFVKSMQHLSEKMQFATAEIRRGKKIEEEEEPQGKI